MLLEDPGRARMMRVKAYRDDQWAHRYTGRVAAINQFIDKLGGKRARPSFPYIPPICGGIEALALSVSRDQGPIAGGINGSGFLSIENDDPSAERMGRFREAGIDYGRVSRGMPTRGSSTATRQRRAGRGRRASLRDLIGLIPRLRVVILHGTAAAKGWKLFLQEHHQLG